MKIKDLFRTPLTRAQSIMRQSQIEEVDHIEPIERELTAYEFKKACQIQAWATRQLKVNYLEQNPTVKEARK